MARVHPKAEVAASAVLAGSVEVGPFAVIGPDVELGPDVQVGPHAVVCGRTSVGAGTRIFPFAVVGEIPQDQKYAGESTALIIGTHNVIREHTSLHVGTAQGGGATRIGDHNLFMNGVHVAHDCHVGSHTILASYTALGGHVIVEDYAVLGGYTGVHQFCRVGESAMAAGASKISQDVPPFSLVAGDRARLVGLNAVGMKRRAFSPETLSALKRAFHIVFQSKLRLEPALLQVQEEIGGVPEVLHFVEFLRKSERGFCR